MIERLFDSFLINHFTNSERFDGLVMWFVCTVFMWWQQIKHSERAIKGMENSNRFWEGHEQVIYWSMLAMWPIVFRGAFITKDGLVPIEVWYFLGFLVGFALLGRSILDYALAFFGRAPVKKDEPVKVTTETTTETTINKEQ